MRKYVLLISVLFLSGCAQFFTAKTTASYKLPNGPEISYSSDKEQTGLDATISLDETGKLKGFRIRVDKSSTQEEVINATLQMQLQLMKLLETAVNLGKAAATKGAVQ